jgi:hypothetical protein
MTGHDLHIEAENKLHLYERSKTIGAIARVLTLGIWGNQRAIDSRREEYDDAQANAVRFDGLMQRHDNSELFSDLEGVRLFESSPLSIEHSDVGEYGPDWSLLSTSALMRDNYECQEQDGYCRGPLQAHHKIPLSRGGANSLGNLVTLCKYHHSLKHEHMRGKV